MTAFLSVGQELATFLAAQSVSVPFAETLYFNNSTESENNIFVGTMPDLPDLAVAVYERPGMSPLTTLTGLSAAESLFDRPVCQVRVRAGNGAGGYDTGQALVQAIFGALQGVNETVLNVGGQLFHLVEAMQSPVWLGRGTNVDPRQRPNWSQNFLVWFQNDARA